MTLEEFLILVGVLAFLAGFAYALFRAEDD